MECVTPVSLVLTNHHQDKTVVCLVPSVLINHPPDHCRARIVKLVWGRVSQDHLPVHLVLPERIQMGVSVRFVLPENPSQIQVNQSVMTVLPDFTLYRANLAAPLAFLVLCPLSSRALVEPALLESFLQLVSLATLAPQDGTRRKQDPYSVINVKLVNSVTQSVKANVLHVCQVPI